LLFEVSDKSPLLGIYCNQWTSSANLGQQLTIVGAWRWRDSGHP